MAKVIQAACGVPRLSLGHFIPESCFPPQCHTVVSISVLFLSCTFYCNMLHTAAALIEGVCSLPHDPHNYTSACPQTKTQKTLPHSLCPAHKISPDNFDFLPSMSALLSHNLVPALIHPSPVFPLAALFSHPSVTSRGQGWCDRFFSTSKHLVWKPENGRQSKGPSDLF